MKKFKDACNGLKKAFNHKAVKVQVCLGLLAVIGGFLIHLHESEWLAFIICIGMVISAEIMNTAIEFLCNYIQEDFDEKIGTIKDLASAAVLVSALCSLIIAIITVLRRIQ